MVVLVFLLGTFHHTNFSFFPLINAFHYFSNEFDTSVIFFVWCRQRIILEMNQINQSVNQLINQSINQPTDQSINRSIIQ